MSPRRHHEPVAIGALVLAVVWVALTTFEYRAHYGGFAGGWFLYVQATVTTATQGVVLVAALLWLHHRFVASE